MYSKYGLEEASVSEGHEEKESGFGLVKGNHMAWGKGGSKTKEISMKNIGVRMEILWNTPHTRKQRLTTNMRFVMMNSERGGEIQTKLKITIS